MAPKVCTSSYWSFYRFVAIVVGWKALVDENESQLWHRRYGHLSYQSVFSKKLSTVHGLPPMYKTKAFVKLAF